MIPNLLALTEIEVYNGFAPRLDPTGVLSGSQLCQMIIDSRRENFLLALERRACLGSVGILHEKEHIMTAIRL